MPVPMMPVPMMPVPMPVPAMMVVMPVPTMPVADLLHQAGVGVGDRVRLGHRGCGGDGRKVGHGSDRGRGEGKSSEHREMLHCLCCLPEGIDAP